MYESFKESMVEQAVRDFRCIFVSEFREMKEFPFNEVTFDKKEKVISIHYRDGGFTKVIRFMQYSEVIPTLIGQVLLPLLEKEKLNKDEFEYYKKNLFPLQKAIYALEGA